MKTLFFLAAGCLLTLGIRAQTAQPGYRIEATIGGIADSTCFLAHYLDAQHAIKDTAKADANGRLLFEGTKTLPQGLYVVSVGRWRYFDLIVTDDQHFSLRTDTSSFMGNMKVEGSRENSLFYDYNQAMQKRYEELRLLQVQNKLRNGDATSESMANVKARALQRDMSEYRRKFIADNAGTFVAKLFKAATDPDIPPAPRLPDGRPDSLFAYQYYKAHYFDNLDLTDERMLRTPLLTPKIERYFSDLVVQTPDSLIKEADFVLSKVPKGQKEMRRFLIYKITAPYETPKILGTEGLFVHMGEKYYIGESEMYDSSTVRRFKERVATLKPLLTGKKLPNLALTDTLGRPVPLYDVKAEYTLVFIYDPECSHCRESTPKVLEFYKQVKNQGLVVYAVNVKRDPEQWKKFIREFKTGSFINGIDLKYTADFFYGFDAQSTPVIYLLDRDKKIIVRRLPATELAGYWAFMQRQKAAATPSTASPGEKKKTAGR